MTIRSTVVVGLLVLGSGAFALAQGVPGFPFPGPPNARGAQKTTLTTSPVAGVYFTCRLLNVGKSPLPVSSDTIKIFANPQPGEAEFAISYAGSSCVGSLKPGYFCDAYANSELPTVANCTISFNGNSDSVRGAMEVMQFGQDPTTTALVVDAR